MTPNPDITGYFTAAKNREAEERQRALDRKAQAEAQQRQLVVQGIVQPLVQGLMQAGQQALQAHLEEPEKLARLDATRPGERYDAEALERAAAVPIGEPREALAGRPDEPSTVERERPAMAPALPRRDAEEPIGRPGRHLAEPLADVIGEDWTPPPGYERRPAAAPEPRPGAVPAPSAAGRREAEGALGPRMPARPAAAVAERWGPGEKAEALARLGRPVGPAYPAIVGRDGRVIRPATTGLTKWGEAAETMGRASAVAQARKEAQTQHEMEGEALARQAEGRQERRLGFDVEKEIRASVVRAEEAQAKDNPYLLSGGLPRMIPEGAAPRRFSLRWLAAQSETADLAKRLYAEISPMEQTLYARGGDAVVVQPIGPEVAAALKRQAEEHWKRRERVARAGATKFPPPDVQMTGPGPVYLPSGDVVRTPDGRSTYKMYPVAPDELREWAEDASFSWTPEQKKALLEVAAIGDSIAGRPEPFQRGQSQSRMMPLLHKAGVYRRLLHRAAGATAGGEEAPQVKLRQAAEAEKAKAVAEAEAGKRAAAEKLAVERRTEARKLVARLEKERGAVETKNFDSDPVAKAYWAQSRESYPRVTEGRAAGEAPLTGRDAQAWLSKKATEAVNAARDRERQRLAGELVRARADLKALEKAAKPPPAPAAPRPPGARRSGDQGRVDDDRTRRDMVRTFRAIEARPEPADVKRRRFLAEARRRGWPIPEGV